MGEVIRSITGRRRKWKLHSCGLNGQFEPFAFHHSGSQISTFQGIRHHHDLLGVVDPEEVRVQDGLHDARNHRDRIEETRRLEISPNPIRNIQRPVNPKCSQIMGRDRLRLAGPLQHEQLWQDCNRLQPYRKSPQYLRNRVLVWKEYCKYCATTQKVAYFKRVEIGVVRRFVVVQHEVECIRGRGEEDDLEHSVPGRVGERPEEICQGISIFFGR